MKTVASWVLVALFMLVMAPSRADPPEMMAPQTDAYRLIAHQAMEREASAWAEVSKLRVQIDSMAREQIALRAKVDELTKSLAETAAKPAGATEATPKTSN